MGTLLVLAVIFLLLVIPFSAFSPTDRTELKTAVDSWVRNRTEAMRVYEKPIGEWDVSSVEDMLGMFLDAFLLILTYQSGTFHRLRICKACFMVPLLSPIQIYRSGTLHR